MSDEMVATAPRRRMTAVQREQQLLQAAVTAFAQGGYPGTTTDQVARLAGVSQPYVLRLFGSKQALFLAERTTRVCLDRPEEPLSERERELYEACDEDRNRS